MRTRNIQIHHQITVDECIAEEISELNNLHGIVTMYSCCGHGYKNGAFITVRLDCISKMLAMGYELAGHRRPNQDTFRPKSGCQCRATKRCSKCGKRRRGRNEEPFLCDDCFTIEREG